jgi:hypothetical protein
MRPFIVLSAFAVALASKAYAVQANHVISFNGIGLVSIGIAKPDAEKILGKTVKEGIIYDAPPEYRTGTVEGESFILYLTKSKITCISAQDAGYVTDKGIKVGDAFDTVKAIYSRYPMQEKEFDYQEGLGAPMEKGRQLAVTGDNNHQLVFTAYHATISTIAVTATDGGGIPSCKL